MKIVKSFNFKRAKEKEEKLKNRANKLKQENIDKNNIKQTTVNKSNNRRKL
jgi:hypothetical protein